MSFPLETSPIGEVLGFLMAETIVWYILLLAIGAGVVFAYGIADDVFHRWRQRNNMKKKLETENDQTVKAEPVQTAISTKPAVVRGYDSRDLFWEDALLRIDELKRQIAAELKKGHRLSEEKRAFRILTA
jgi:hypothetical protein